MNTAIMDEDGEPGNAQWLLDLELIAIDCGPNSGTRRRE
jgi:hypothetical protein